MAYYCSYLEITFTPRSPTPPMDAVGFSIRDGPDSNLANTGFSIRPPDSHPAEARIRIPRPVSHPAPGPDSHPAPGPDLHPPRGPPSHLGPNICASWAPEPVPNSWGGWVGVGGDEWMGVWLVPFEGMFLGVRGGCPPKTGVGRGGVV